MNASCLTPEQVCNFWFGASPWRYRKVWFNSTPSNDRVTAQFAGSTLSAALGGALHAWQATRAGRFALVLLLDQFTRTVYRGSALAFSGDDAALAISIRAFAAGDAAGAHPFAVAFLAMPYMHQEDDAAQREGVARFTTLHDESGAVDTVLAKHTKRFLSSALEHQQIIAQFGRFPHRNAVLGRMSTAEEQAFMQQSGRTFGQRRR